MVIGERDVRPRRWTRAAVVLLAAAAMTVPVAASARAADGPGLDSTRLAALAQPVVQLVQVDLEATITSPDSVANAAADKALQKKLWAQQRNGQLAMDTQSINRQWLDAHRRDVDRYFLPRGKVQGTTKLTSTCSGWFATPDGFLVTAAHCVQPDRAQLLKQLTPKALASFIARDKAQSLRNFRDIPLDAGMRADLMAISEQWYLRHATLTTLKVTVSVHVAVPGDAGRRGAQVTTAELVSAGESFPGRDVALLKVDGFDDLPSLALGDDGALQVGDTLYLDGFPGTVLASAQLSEASRREPSFTQGPVSALRNTVNGVAYLQTQAPAYHGNSGGPVLNARGEVIGILVAGVADPQTGQAVEGQEFVLRRDGVAQELSRHNVTAVTSPTTREYATALADYHRSYFSRAKKEFEQLRTRHPHHPYATHYVTLCAQEIEAGNDRTPGFPWLAVGLGVALLVIAGLLAAILLLLRRRSAPPAPVAAVFPQPVTPDVVTPQPVTPDVVTPQPVTPGAVVVDLAAVEAETPGVVPPGVVAPVAVPPVAVPPQTREVPAPAVSDADAVADTVAVLDTDADADAGRTPGA